MLRRLFAHCLHCLCFGFVLAGRRRDDPNFYVRALGRTFEILHLFSRDGRTIRGKWDPCFRPAARSKNCERNQHNRLFCLHKGKCGPGPNKRSIGFFFVLCLVGLNARPFKTLAAAPEYRPNLDDPLRLFHALAKSAIRQSVPEIRHDKCGTRECHHSNSCVRLLNGSPVSG